MNNAVTEISVWQVLVMGGPMMWPIVLCSVFALTVVFQKCGYFWSIEEEGRSLKERLFACVHKNDIKAAIILCNGSSLAAARILKAGLMMSGSSKDVIDTAMEDEARFAVPELEKGIAALSTIAAVAPLLGLLGTVLGFCSAFHVFQARAAAMNPATSGDIAGSVWQALITTAAGLVVGIMALLAHNYLVSRLDRAVEDMEKAAVDLARIMTRIAGASDPGGGE